MAMTQLHFLGHSPFFIPQVPKFYRILPILPMSAFPSDGQYWCQRARRKQRGRVNCSDNKEIGSEEWLARANPLEVLGLQDEDYTEDEIKAAFRAKVKEFHPDVYKGPGNASSIVQRVIKAYEILIKRISQGEYIQRSNSDPFEEPDCEALDIFVNEFLCIGKGCPYSCVKRAPHVFSYAPDTRCARAVTQGQGEDYQVQLAVGQCPENCIFYVTPSQRVILEELLARALESNDYLNEASMLESLIARANFENNRYQGRPKRNTKQSTKWVDWY